MKELFRTADVRNVLVFIKKTHFTTIYYDVKLFYISYVALLFVYSSTIHGSLRPREM